MAKDIDLTKPLSDGDRAWLLERGRYGDVAVNEGSSIAEVVEQDAADNPDLSDVQFTPVSASDAAEAKAARAAAAPSGRYSELTVDELKDELEARDLAKSGNKSELIARLEEDDAADAGSADDE